MIHIAICEDNATFKDLLKTIICSYFEVNTIKIQIDLFGSENDIIIQETNLTKYQIFFLDIMTEPSKCIETAQLIKRQNPMANIIIISSSIQHAIAGYRAEALRYVIKEDVNIKHMIYESLDAACKKMNYSTAAVEIPFSNGTKKIFKNNIIYVESNLHKVVFHILEREIKDYTMYGHLNAINEFVDQDKMIRIHQSFLINMDYCQKMLYNKAILINRLELPISRTYSKKARNAFLYYRK